jgi:hypothetical protein
LAFQPFPTPKDGPSLGIERSEVLGDEIRVSDKSTPGFAYALEAHQGFDRQPWQDFHWQIFWKTPAHQHVSPLLLLLLFSISVSLDVDLNTLSLTDFVYAEFVRTAFYTVNALFQGSDWCTINHSIYNFLYEREYILYIV